MTKRNAMVLSWGTIWFACADVKNCGDPPTIIGPDGAAGSTAMAFGGSAGGATTALGGGAGIATGGSGGNTTIRLDGAAGDAALGLDGGSGNTTGGLDGSSDRRPVNLGGSTGRGGAAGDTGIFAGGTTGRGGSAGSTVVSNGGGIGRGGSAGSTAVFAGGATGRGGVAGSTVTSRGGATGLGGVAGSTAISTGGAGGTTTGSNGGAAGGSGVGLDAADLRDTEGSLDVPADTEAPVLAGCRIFPPDNPWNQDVSGYPLNANSATYLANMSPGTAFHPDWGTVSDGYGIPFSSGTGATPQPITWTAGWGASESDPLPCPSGGGQFCYPIPLTAPIEGGTSADVDADRHVLYLDTAGAPNNCTLYELYNAQNPTGSSGWTAANGAIFHLGSNALRTDGWTSADAAGLPILPGLVRFDEVMAGEIRHAIRFTVSRSSQGYIHPATHAAGSSNTSLPPMGLRLRLKASFDTSRFSGPTLVILTAMKKYGIILADNGSNWYITGESNQGWAPYMDGLLSGLRQLHGSDFEVVDTGPVLTEES